MFGIGTTELLIIILVALVVLGPQKLPQVMKAMGKGLAEFKRLSTDVKSTLDAEVSRAEREERRKEKELAEKKAKPSQEAAGKAEKDEASLAAEAAEARPAASHENAPGAVPTDDAAPSRPDIEAGPAPEAQASGSLAEVAKPAAGKDKKDKPGGDAA